MDDNTTSVVNKTDLTGWEEAEATTKDTFMEEVNTYMIFKIATYIANYWFPILVPIGWIGNTLSFIIMLKRNNRNISTCIYMAAISVNDSFMMYAAFHYWLIGATNIRK